MKYWNAYNIFHHSIVHQSHGFIILFFMWKCFDHGHLYWINIKVSIERKRSPVEMVWWVRMTEWTIQTSPKSFIMLFFISQIQSLYFNSTSNTQTVVSYTGPTNRFSTKGWIPVEIIWWVRTTQWSIQTSSKSFIMRFYIIEMQSLYFNVL